MTQGKPEKNASPKRCQHCSDVEPGGLNLCDACDARMCSNCTATGSKSCGYWCQECVDA